MFRTLSIKVVTGLIAVTILVLFSSISMAQNKNEDKYYLNNTDRKWLLEIPIWIPGFRGEFVFGDIQLSSSNEKEEKQEKDRLTDQFGLEFFFIGRAEVRFNRFWAHMDAFSGRINTSTTYDRIIGTSQPELYSINIQLTISRINAGYSIWSTTNDQVTKLEIIPYLGFRFHDVGISGAILDSVYSRSVAEYWIDPLIGIYIPVSFKRFMFKASWDIGLSNSKTSWLLFIQAQYRISKLIDVKIGWQHLNLAYEKTIRDTNLELNIKLAGPSAGIGFRF